MSEDRFPARKTSGGLRRNSSSDMLLETADDLVDKLDVLADIVEEVDKKYNVHQTVDEDAEADDSGTDFRLNQRLREGLDSARTLIGCLQREKWRLSRRKMSVELRMGELEDYKSHIKQDMTSLNETVDILSHRLIELENALCDEQEIQEDLEAEKKELTERLTESEDKIKDLEKERETLTEEVTQLRRQRSNSSLHRELEELRGEFELMQLENHHLKDLIRALEDENKPQSQDGGHDAVIIKNKENLENNNDKIILPSTECESKVTEDTKM
ncbi:hypothetical protein FSP39_022973 [Pinctada imbricata]|uniref:Uncharacterized protein n=1 Tax=Pinctada imbricata TaxID=66713 RepID=A0AA89BTL3_PINIB|nr:hypothetical protein FSP39_022973 [Pinctada imbricata]